MEKPRCTTLRGPLRGTSAYLLARRRGDRAATRLMKILFLGEIGPGQTSLMRMRALERLGYTVRGVNTVAPWKRATWLKRQTQRRLQRGSIIDAINASAL